MNAAREMSSFGLSRVRIRGFRSARDVSFTPGPLCALVGEAGAGKSNVLSALWRLLSAQALPLEKADFFEHGGEASAIRHCSCLPRCAATRWSPPQRR